MVQCIVQQVRHCIRAAKDSYLHQVTCVARRIDPIAYIQTALAINEFNAPRWLNLPVGTSNAGTTLLSARGIPQKGKLPASTTATLCCLTLSCNVAQANLSEPATMTTSYMPLLLVYRSSSVLHLACSSSLRYL